MTPSISAAHHRIISPGVAPGGLVPMTTLGTNPVTGSAYITPTDYRVLVKDYLFTGASLPTDWVAINGSNEGYTVTQYNSAQVTMTGAAASLNAQTGGPLGYVSGFITTKGGYTLPANPPGCRLRFHAKMPALSGGGWPNGMWPALWAVNPQANNPQGEIDVNEMPFNATDVYATLHDWTTSFASSSYVGTVANALSAFQIYEVIWEPGMITFGINGAAFAQLTKTFIGAGNWPFDVQLGTYINATLGVQGGEWVGAPLPDATSIAAMTPTNKLSMLVSEIEVYIAHVVGTPVNVSPPTISGSDINGHTLTASTGSWTGSPGTFTYQWLNDAIPIGGATSSTYLLTSGDVGDTITVAVIANNGVNSLPSTSAGVGPILDAIPVNSTPPTITGSATEPSTLTGNPGTWLNSPTGFVWQWARSGADVIGETASTYDTGTADLTKTITVRVIGQNPAGSSPPVTSAPFGPILAPGAGDRTTFELTSSFLGPGPTYPLSDAAALARVTPVAEGATTKATNVLPTGTSTLRGSPAGTTAAGSRSQLQNASGLGPNAYYPTNADLVTFHNACANVHAVNGLFFVNPYWPLVTGQPFGPPIAGARGGNNFTLDVPLTTDEIIQWAWHKWGLPTKMGRAEMVQETSWQQPNTGDWGATGSAPYDATSYNLSLGYSKSTVSPGRCRSLGIAQWSSSADGVHSGFALPMVATDPMRYLSTAFCADFCASVLRLYYDNPPCPGTTLGWALSVCGNNSGGQGYITGESQGNAGGTLDNATSAQLLPMGGGWFHGGFGGYNVSAAVGYVNSTRAQAKAVGSPSFGTGTKDVWLTY